MKFWSVLFLLGQHFVVKVLLIIEENNWKLYWIKKQMEPFRIPLEFSSHRIYTCGSSIVMFIIDLVWNIRSHLGIRESFVCVFPGFGMKEEALIKEILSSPLESVDIHEWSVDCIVENWSGQEKCQHLYSSCVT